MQWRNDGVGRVDSLGGPSAGVTEFQKKIKRIILFSQITQTLYCHLHRIYT